ncbi:MAG: hypothetical protein L0206_05565 [Actinobacteria bacterium]|nr:hypothetical protein [Actinomycetota bacterium]
MRDRRDPGPGGRRYDRTDRPDGAHGDDRPDRTPAPTGSTDGVSGAVSLAIPAEQNPTGAAVYSCDGIEGTWTYEPGELPVQGIEITFVAAPFSMEGGDGTLVIEGTVVIPGAGEATFTDTIDLEIGGTASAPTMTSAGVHVDTSGAIEGLPIDFAQFFPEDTSFPIVPGAERC